MKRFSVLIVVLTLFYVAALSQLQTLEVKEIQSDGAIPIFTDYPDNAAIIIYTSLTRLSISSNMGIVSEKSDPNDGKYVLIVRPIRQVFRIQCPGFMETSYKTPILKPKQVLYLSVEQATGPEIPAVIMTEPADATVTVDGVDLGKGPNYKIATGPHDIKVQKTGFKSITQKIDISDDSNVFSYTLKENEPVMVTLKTDPPGASIFIDDVAEGRTNKQLFKFPGEYNIRLSLSKYETVEQTINVTESSNNIWSFNLVKTTAILTVITTPSDAQIWINGELKNTKNLEVAPGQYRIEVKKDGWYTDSRTVIVEKGKDQTQSLTLQQMTGKLQLVVEPMETQVVMKQNNRQIDSWTGSQFLNNIPVGQYIFDFSARGYSKQSRKVTIEENENVQLEINMDKITETKVVITGTVFYCNTENYNLKPDAGSVIKFISNDMGDTFETISDKSGNYIINIYPGAYDITCFFQHNSPHKEEIKNKIFTESRYIHFDFTYYYSDFPTKVNEKDTNNSLILIAVGLLLMWFGLGMPGLG